jgi:molybdopterin molybdotransferase
MMTVEEATRVIREKLPNWGEEEVALSEISSGETTADLIADRDYPPFDRVMMDGIAVSWRSFEEGIREFQIHGVCAAGQPQVELNDPRACYEIMTGAPLPKRADLIIPYEEIVIENGRARVSNEVARTKMEYVHPKGSDAQKGSVLLSRGSVLDGPTWGIAASVGAATVPIKRSPRIMIVSTGDELIPVDQSPLEHQIRRSNAYALKASLNLHHYRHVTLSHLRDDPDEVRDHYHQNKDKFDLLIYSGGVSKGKFDYLPPMWKEAGVTEYLHGVSQRPGKPLWFGVDEKNKTVVLGLPGNPVSSLVCLHRYFLNQKEIYAELASEFNFAKKLTYFLPVRLEFTSNGMLKAHPLKIKNSGEFSALAGSDGFLELPKDESVFPVGATYRFHPWRPL